MMARCIIWQMPAGAMLRTMEVEDTAAHSVDFSPDAKTVVVAYGDTQVRIWDVVSGQLFGH